MKKGYYIRHEDAYEEYGSVCRLYRVGFHVEDTIEVWNRHTGWAVWSQIRIDSRRRQLLFTGEGPEQALEILAERARQHGIGDKRRHRQEDYNRSLV